MRRSLAVRVSGVLFAVLVSLFLFVAPAVADDCVPLGGVFDASSGECRIAGTASVSGAFVVDSTLRVLDTGGLVVDPAAPGATLTLTVNGGLVVDAGAHISGDVTDPSAVASTIAITASGDVLLDGNGTTGARVTANGNATSCAGTGSAGAVTITTTGGTLTVAAGSRITVNSQCPAGSITLRATDGDIAIAGEVESASGASQGGQVTSPRGGPITIAAAGTLAIAPSARVRSAGLAAGAARVHLESGLDTFIHGFVQSTGGMAFDGRPNGCTGTERAGKPAMSTACVEVWAGGDIEIDSNAPRLGFVRTSNPGTGSSSACCAWIDLFATGDIRVLGAPGASQLPFAVNADQLLSPGFAGHIAVKAVRGKVTSSGRAFSAVATSGPGGIGGTISIEAGGPVDYEPLTPPAMRPADPASNVDLGSSLIGALGNTNAPGTGTIYIRSFNGTITGGDGSLIALRGLLQASSGGEVSLRIPSCATPAYVGVMIPSNPPVEQQCGGRPELPAFATLPTFLLRPTLTLPNATFTFDFANPTAEHRVTATVTGVNGEPLLPLPTVSYTDALGAPVEAPVAIGVYAATATFAGNAEYRAATATATLIINAPDLVRPTMTLPELVTRTYTGGPHAVSATTIPSVTPVDCTYNGSSQAPTTVGTYAVTCTFPGNLQYGAVSAATTLVIDKATPTVTASSGGGPFTYDGNFHGGTGTATGVLGEALTPVVLTYDTPSGLAPREEIGSFTLTVSFAGNTNYTAAVATATITIVPATPAISLTGGTFVFDGLPHPATAAVRGVNGEILDHLLEVTYTPGGSAVPVGAGSYQVSAVASGNARYVTVSATTTIIIAGSLSPTITLSGGGTFSFDHQPHAVTGTVTGIDGQPIEPSLVITYRNEANAVVAVPIAPGTYVATATFAGNLAYVAATATATVVITPGTVVSFDGCIMVDFREVTYFRDTRVLTSSDAGIRARNGIAGDFDPELWPYGTRGKNGTSASRGTLFRIYGFTPAQAGMVIPDADVPAGYVVTVDADVPGAHYIDLGGPARVVVCPDQLQPHLLDHDRVKPWHLPGTRRLTKAETNVPGIMLSANVDRIKIPGRVQAELRTLGLPAPGDEQDHHWWRGYSDHHRGGSGYDGNGRHRRWRDEHGRHWHWHDDDDRWHREDDGRCHGGPGHHFDREHGLVSYIAVQQAGGEGPFREFVNVEVQFIGDDAADRRAHYRLGFHTVQGHGQLHRSSCRYVDAVPGDDAARFHDVWEGRHTHDREWGYACGALEPRANQTRRADDDLPLNAVQILSTAGGGDDAPRLFYGEIRPAH